MWFEVHASFTWLLASSGRVVGARTTLRSGWTLNTSQVMQIKEKEYRIKTHHNENKQQNDTRRKKKN